MARSGGGAGARQRGALRTGVAAVALVVMGACGESDDGSPSAAVTPSRPTATASASPTPSAAPLDAEDFLLTEGPETAGFVSRPGSSDDSDGPRIDVLAKCLGIPVERLQDKPVDEANGDDFVSKTNEIVMAGSEAEVVPASQVASHLEALRHPRFAECFGAEFEHFLAKENATPGVRYKLVSLEKVEPPTGANGDARISMDITAAGETVEVVFDAVFIMKGRVEATLFFSNPDKPMPANTVQPMVDQVVTKINKQ